MLVLGQARAELLVWCKKFCQSWARPGQNFEYIVKSSAHLGSGQGRTFAMLAKDSPILGQIRIKLVANHKKFCPSRAWPGQNFWYNARSCAHLGPGQGRILHSFQKVLPVLGQAMAELFGRSQKVLPHLVPYQGLMAQASAHLRQGQGGYSI